MGLPFTGLPHAHTHCLCLARFAACTLHAKAKLNHCTHCPSTFAHASPHTTHLHTHFYLCPVCPCMPSVPMVSHTPFCALHVYLHTLPLLTIHMPFSTAILLPHTHHTSTTPPPRLPVQFVACRVYLSQDSLGQFGLFTGHPLSGLSSCTFAGWAFEV